MHLFKAQLEWILLKENNCFIFILPLLQIGVNTKDKNSLPFGRITLVGKKQEVTTFFFFVSKNSEKT